MAITLEPLVQIEFCKFLLIADIQGFLHMQNEHCNCTVCSNNNGWKLGKGYDD